MPLYIVRNDITKMKVDAIVNAANPSLLGGGGVDGAIHRAAGPELVKECMTLGGCKEGEAKITNGYDLYAKYVIHTVGPVWRGGKYGERKTLQSCYTESLQSALNAGCNSVAFPLISSGAYGYPKEKAFEAAVEAITAFLLENDIVVYLVIFERNSSLLDSGKFSEIKRFIDENYHPERCECGNSAAKKQKFKKPSILSKRKSSKFDGDIPTCGAAAFESPALKESFKESMEEAMSEKPMASSLEEALKMRDESFSEMLMRKIDETGMTDSECYKKANIDRKLFSKIRSDRFYRPSKPTALAFAIALRLSLAETKELLEKAGFALSKSNKFDIIVEYFIREGNYNIFEINEALFAFDQNQLGTLA